MDLFKWLVSLIVDLLPYKCYCEKLNKFDSAIFSDNKILCNFREVRPVYNASSAVRIQVGITLTQIFDMVSNPNWYLVISTQSYIYLWKVPFWWSLLEIDYCVLRHAEWWDFCWIHVQFFLARLAVWDTDLLNFFLVFCHFHLSLDWHFDCFHVSSAWTWNNKTNCTKRRRADR